MKKKTLEGICLAVVITALVFVMTACNNPSGPPVGYGGGGGSLKTKNLTIAGTLGTGEKFIAKAGSGSGALSVRAISASDFKLSGRLEDGSIIFLLEGSYNTDTKTYSLSAAGSKIIYTISGEFNDNGVAVTGKAVVQTRANISSPWTTSEVPITTATTSGAVADINNALKDPGLDEAENDAPDSIPATWRGIWRDTADAGYYALVNAYSVILYEKLGNTWMETETMYFTKITNAGGVCSGETTYMDWDRDLVQAAKPNWWQDMLVAYAALKGISYKDQRLLEAEFSLTSQADTIVSKSAYNRLTTMYGWSLPWNSPYNQTFYDDFNVWYHTTKGYTGQPTLARLQEYANDIINGGKAACTAAGAVVERQLTAKSNDVYPGNWIITLIDDGGEMHEMSPAAMTQMNNCWNELGKALNTYAKNQGYVTENSVREKMYNDGYENTWLEANCTPKENYYFQWYAKMALKLQGGKLIPGYYVKDSGDGSWDGLEWSANDWENDTPPVWAVKTYSQINTLDSLKWEKAAYGLSR